MMPLVQCVIPGSAQHQSLWQIWAVPQLYPREDFLPISVIIIFRLITLAWECGDRLRLLGIITAEFGSPSGYLPTEILASWCFLTPVLYSTRVSWKKHSLLAAARARPWLCPEKQPCWFQPFTPWELVSPSLTTCLQTRSVAFPIPHQSEPNQAFHGRIWFGCNGGIAEFTISAGRAVWWWIKRG